MKINYLKAIQAVDKGEKLFLDHMNKICFTISEKDKTLVNSFKSNIIYALTEASEDE